MNQLSRTKAKLIDNPSVSEIFADDFVGYIMHGDTVTLTFAAHRPDHANPPDVHRIVTARLTLTVSAAARIQEAIVHCQKTIASRDSGKTASTSSSIQ